jgi:phospholipase C
MAVIPPIDSTTAGNNLRDLDHLFVVMMENRSFDQMLGYRSVARSGGALDPNVDGISADGEIFGIPGGFLPAFHQPETLFDGDPPHSRRATLESLGPVDALRGGTTFAEFFRNSLAGAQNAGDRHANPDLAKGVLGYHDEREVPIIHHLAEQFCVCDRWFSSSAGSTWANRLFLYYGRSGSDDQPLIDNLDLHEGDERRDARQDDREERKTAVAELDLEGRDKRQAGREMRRDQRDDRKVEREEKQETQPRRRDCRDAINTPSIFDVFEAADQATWGVYHDGAIPWRALLPHQREGRHGRVRKLSTLDQDIRQGDIPKLVFLDPDFFGLNQNDDHAPADVTKGQRFLKRVYDLLTEKPDLFGRSALVVIWDEHGGFYDHVDPRRFPTGDLAPFEHYGVRVPALVAGGRIPARSVSKQVFDHTSVMATAVRAFAPSALASLPQRVRNAKHLGFLMTEPERSSFAPSPEVLRTPRNASRNNEQFRQWMSMVGMR